MGCTGSTHEILAHKIIKKFGATKAFQFALQQEKKQYINKNFPQIKEKILKDIDNQTRKALKSIDEKENQIQNQYKARINKIQKAEKGSIGKAEQLQKQSAKKMFGLDDLRDDLYNLRVNTKISFHNERQKIQKEVDQKIQLYKKQLDKLKVDQYEDLKQNEKAEVRECIKRKHENTTQNQIKKLQKYLDQNFNYQNFAKKFAKLDPQLKLKEIQEDKDKKFNAGQQKITGSAGCATC